MAIRKYQQTFTVPAGAGSYAAEIVRFAPPAFSAAAQYDPDYKCTGIVANVVAAVATAVLEIWLCGAGLDPTLDANYAFFSAIANGAAVGGANVPLASWVGVQIRAKSGGTAAVLNAGFIFG